MNPARRSAARFEGSRFLRGYARGKTKWDPAYPAVAEILRGSPLPLLDVGCGIGLLAAYLREAGCTQPIRGIEPDASKVRKATELVASHYPALEFSCGDARHLPGFSGDVVVLDVLHYLETSEQERVLRDLADRVASGGRMLLRTALREKSWRYTATLLEEIVVRATGWIRGGNCQFPSFDEMSRPLREAGLVVSLRPMWGKTPFNSYLVEACRP